MTDPHCTQWIQSNYFTPCVNFQPQMCHNPLSLKSIAIEHALLGKGLVSVHIIMMQKREIFITVMSLRHDAVAKKQITRGLRKIWCWHYFKIKNGIEIKSCGGSLSSCNSLLMGNSPLAENSQFQRTIFFKFNHQYSKLWIQLICIKSYHSFNLCLLVVTPTK